MEKHTRYHRKNGHEQSDQARLVAGQQGEAASDFDHDSDDGAQLRQR